MKGRWVSIILALFLLVFSGCGEKPAASQSSSRLLMGTLVTITLWSEAGQGSKTAAAMQTAFAEMERIEALMSSHRSNSAVGMINQAERGHWLPLNEETGRVIAAGLAMQRQSNGAFDVGLWPLTRLWGFSQEPPPTAPPSRDSLEQWVKSHPRTEGVQLRGEGSEGQIRLTNDAVGLDLGAIAKGYAVDRALDRLEQLGFANAIVNAGGNLGVSGSKGGTPWRIGIQHPRKEDGVVAEVVLPRRTALVTSGDYERFFIHEGKRYHHILDPNLGVPADRGVISASILHPSAMMADALSTAAFVLGLEQGMALVKGTPWAEALFIMANGHHEASSGFQYRWLGMSP